MAKKKKKNKQDELKKDRTRAKKARIKAQGQDLRMGRPEDFQQPPLRHEELSPELLERIRDIWSIIKPFFHEPTFEQFELGFLRDMHPEREIHIWSGIALGLMTYIVKFPDASFADQNAAYVAFVTISMCSPTKPDDVPQSIWKQARSIAKELEAEFPPQPIVARRRPPR